ncbi:MAG: hypothetical protein IJV83_01080 [Clostridia bacterium]|nr:hypothetical protein [Clostridia bacterium]
MKKILMFLLCFGFIFLLFGCNNDNGVKSSDSNSNEISGESSDGNGNSGTLEENSFFTVTAGYDYGFYVEGTVSVLYDQCSLFFNLPSGFAPSVAGDTFTVEHTGEAYTLDSYPAHMSISGEIVSVIGQKAEILPIFCQYLAAPAVVGESPTINFFLYNDGVIGEQLKIKSRPQYYVTQGENGEWGYEQLATVEDGMVLYASYSAVNGYDETDGYSFAGLHQWNPREV